MRSKTKRVIGAAIVSVVAAGVGWISVSRAKEAAEQRECGFNLRQLALGLRNYHDSYDAFPPGTIFNEPLPPERRLSWYVSGWGIWADGQVHLEVDRDKAWDVPPNREPRVKYTERDRDGDPEKVEYYDAAPFAFHCPADPRPIRPYPHAAATMDYVGIAGVGTEAPTLPKGHPRAGVFGYDRQTRMADITDGLAQTMTVVETIWQTGPWTAGGPATVRGLDPKRTPYLGTGRPFGGTHRGGALAAFADGSVRFVADSVKPQVFEAAATIAGAETVGPTGVLIWSEPRN